VTRALVDVIRYPAPMRLLARAALLSATTLITTVTFADLGPPPKCGAGTHHEYLYGHRCVPDGSHLERDPAGGVKTVKDNAAASPAPAPSSAPSPAPEPSAGPAPAPTGGDPPAQQVPAAPPAGRGCACGVAGTGGSAAGVLASVAALAALIRRRCRRWPS
jgi:MYXO-CTERM domain-containing protein